MTHATDEQTKKILIELEAIARLGTYGHSLLGRFRTETFGEAEVPACHLRWELLATSIHLHHKPTKWGSRFGPSMSGTNDDGTSWESPPFESITPDCVDYWQFRMANCQHPTLRAHYADLVWDLSSKVNGQRPPIDAARIAIDSYLEAVVGDRIDPPGRQDEVVERMLYLCGKISDDVRWNSVCDELMTHAESGETDDAIVSRMRDLFPLLIETPKKKWPVDLLNRIAERLRRQLESLSAGPGKQWGYESIAIPLADYYQKNGQRDEAIKVLRCYGEAVIAEAQQAKSILAIGWLERAYKLYKKNEMHEDAERVLKVMESRQPELPNELVPMKIPFTIPKDELDDLIDSLLADSVEESIVKIVRCFHPRLDAVRAGMEQLEQASPLQKFFNASLISHAGRTVARIENEDGKLVHRLVQDLDFADVYIQFVFPALISRFKLNTDSILSEIHKAPIWAEERSPLLERGVRAFLEGDTLVATHLLVPEIESAIRNLATDIGVVVQKPHRNGGYVLKNLDDLLREDAVVELLSEDTCFYFRAVFIDQRGWNLRNDVCHGLSTANSLNSRIVRRLMLIILQLSLLRAQPRASEPAGDTSGDSTEGPPTI